jgi:hypothetical protein
MLSHASIPADNPEHVARVIAALWRGEMMPFLPHPGAYMAWSGDERGANPPSNGLEAFLAQLTCATLTKESDTFSKSKSNQSK